MTNRTPKGFTLLELMVVLAIISITAVLAIGGVDRGVPRYRLAAASGSVRQKILDARGRALRKSIQTKLCIFVDDNVADATAKGRILSFDCGPGGCTGAACLDEYAYATAGTVGGNVAALVGGYCTTPSRWCVVNDLDVPSENRGVSLYRYRQGATLAGAVSSAKTLEITFAATGSIAADYTTPSLMQGFIQLVNRDQYNGSSFTNVFDVQYTVGAALRVVEGL